jgi:hypothetical protein
MDFILWILYGDLEEIKKMEMNTEISYGVCDNIFYIVVPKTKALLK